MGARGSSLGRRDSGGLPRVRQWVTRRDRHCEERLCRLAELSPSAQGVRPNFLHDPRREIQAYRILANAGLGTPICHEWGEDWLMLEKIEGVELWQVGDLDRWIDVAAWLARLHGRFAS